MTQRRHTTRSSTTKKASKPISMRMNDMGLSGVICIRFLADQTYCKRFIGGAIHLPSSASGFGM